ncbi:hypothetical protein M231_05311 [Tremella mesenterica]|uniref:Uncharacterized protein n=1 Tax=Tremella mesenterica TaxID=5217 RepID=A0A4Q1BID7_TREME|nr:hypothetical protein M231_05311 [Tremella mesenterica]
MTRIRISGWVRTPLEVHGSLAGSKGGVLNRAALEVHVSGSVPNRNMTTIPPPVQTSGTTEGSIIDTMVRSVRSFIENISGVPKPSAPKWKNHEVKTWFKDGTLYVALKADRKVLGRAQRLGSIYNSAYDDFTSRITALFELSNESLDDREIGRLWYESVCWATERDNDGRRKQGEAAGVSNSFRPYVVHRLPAAPSESGCVEHTLYRTIPPGHFCLPASNPRSLVTGEQVPNGSESIGKQEDVCSSSNNSDNSKSSKSSNDELLEALIITTKAGLRDNVRETPLRTRKVEFGGVKEWRYDSRLNTKGRRNSGEENQSVRRWVPQPVGEALRYGEVPTTVIIKDYRCWVIDPSTGLRYAVLTNYDGPIRSVHNNVHGENQEELGTNDSGSTESSGSEDGDDDSTLVESTTSCY